MDVYDKKSIIEIPKKYNQHDIIYQETCMLHTTQRITQPWKHGLKINFERHIGIKLILLNYIKKIFMLKYNENFLSNYYLKHKNQEVYDYILNLFKDALDKNIISKAELDNSMKMNYIGKEFIKNLNIT